MALFGIERGAHTGCREALAAARLISARLDELNASLGAELDRPLRIGAAAWNEWRADRDETPDLSRAGLRGLDLSGFDLSRTDLRGADLRGTNLSEANLSGAHLDGANLFKAVLDRRGLSRAFLN